MMNTGDKMSFLDILILDIILMIFPTSAVLLYKAYSKNKGNIPKGYLIDIANFSSLFLLIKYCDFTSSYSLLLVNMPFIMSIVYGRKWQAALMAMILIGFNCISYHSFYLASLEYFMYIAIFILLIKKRISLKNILLTFVSVKGVFLTIREYYILGNNNLLTIAQILICLIVFYLVLVLVANIINKMEETINLNQTLKQLEKEKSLKNSLFKITHEVKNPIAVCKGYLSMLDYNDIEKSKKYVKIIESEINRALDIMDNFSEYTKIKVNLDIMDIDYLITDTISNLTPLFKTNNIKANYNYDGEEIYINGDYARLEQVLINMFKNSIEAIKEKGKIEVSLKKRKNNVYIHIKDNGVGISKENIKKMEELFYTTKKKGCGIGVALSKEIVNLHGGSLTYKSKENEYTEVIIKIPIAKSLQ